ncbi:MAG TPA: class I SAM-dependent methyltransferase [Candidatus Saccharimonadia bacterium]|nr:class I SAM-dependent methyltransferase [Candidatus Saccharimonadia bacterium]
MPKPFRYDDLVSPGYCELLHEMHQSMPWGNKGYKYGNDIIEFMSSLGDEGGQMSIIDYGCGQATLIEHYPDLNIRCYDPGVIEFSDMPEPADLVICTDVLEHIEPELLYNVLRHIAELAQMGIYLHIATKPAKQQLPDGRNAHLIVQGLEWWRDKLATISDHWQIRDMIEGSKSLTFWLVRN